MTITVIQKTFCSFEWVIFAKYLEEGLDAGMNATQFNNTQQPKIKNEVLERAEEWAEDRTPYPTEVPAVAVIPSAGISLESSVASGSYNSFMSD